MSNTAGQKSGDPIVVLLADDSESDRNIIKRTLIKRKLAYILHEVENGEQVLQYLRNEQPYDNKVVYPFPSLLLLDINMPIMDGKDALLKIRNDQQLKILPVIMLTTSQRDKDIFDSYSLGVNAYISKPVEPIDFISSIEKIESFWLQLAKLPTRGFQ